MVKGDTTNTTNIEAVVDIAANANAVQIGVLQEAVTEANQIRTVRVAGIAIIDVDGSGTAIDIGDSIIPKAGGQGIKAAAEGATAQFAIGYALAPSAADGDEIPVLIDRHRITKGTA